MTVVHAMLGNAAIAAVLAVIALAVGCVCRSPVVRHAAWVIVLLKLVTPPLFSVPLSVLPASWSSLENPKPETRNPNVEVHAPVSGIQLPQSEIQPPQTAAGSVLGFRLSFSEFFLVVWAVGAIGWFTWQGRRIMRFRRRIANADEAPPEVAEAAGRLAAAMGITQAPAVKLATAIGSPMLWGWGRGAVILFPRELLARLSPEARDTLLAHELAHYLRRDHWVRLLEFVATGLYWWHPAVWLARNGIEVAEEECCDAWVVGGLAASPRRYAEALLATVDFEAELRRPCLPPGACAANRSARLISRRLVGIIHATRPRPLRGGAAVWAVVIATLMTRPVLRAAKPDVVDPPVHSIAATTPLPHSSPSRLPRKAAIEPRAWATAEAEGLSVLARDHEVVLRRPDGTTRTLGPGRPLALAFAPGGQRLATAGPGPLVRTWDDRGTLIAEVHAPAAARSIAYAPDGSALLVLDAAGGITVYNPQTLAPVTNWTVEGPANSITCAPDGRTVAVSFGSWMSESGWVECWSIAECRKLAIYQASAPVGATRYAPDGKTLVIGGWNGLVTWLALPGGELIAERQLTKDLVATTAFCPDAGTLPLTPPPEPAPPPSVVPQPGPEWVPKDALLPER